MVTRAPATGAAAAVAAFAALLCVSDLSAQMGDSRNIQVTATVKGNCRFESTPNINFGELDPALAADKDQAVDVTFKCTRGVNYLLTVGDGLNFEGGKNRMKSSAGTDYIPYEVTPKTLNGTGKGFGATDTISIRGSVKGPDYQNVSAGAYADTVTLSIRP